MTWIRSPIAALALPLLAAFAVRLAAAGWWEARIPDQRFGFGDSDSYWVLAQAIQHGRPYEYGSPDARVFRTPGYPLLLAGWLSLWPGAEPPVYWGRVFSALCGSAAAGAVFALGRALHSRFAGLVAAWIVALHPEAIGMGVFILSEAPFHPLLVVTMLCLVKAHQSLESDDRRTALAYGAGAGLAAAAGTLARPSLLLFLPFCAVVLVAWALIFRGSDRRTRANRAKNSALVYVASMAALCAAMSPWWIRNAYVVGKFVPTSLQVGVSLYDGVSPAATGGSDLSFVPTMEQEFRAEWKQSGAPGVFEVALDDHFRRLAIAWAMQHPGRVAELAWIKLLRIWNVWPNEPGFGRGPLKYIVAIGLVALLSAAAWGAWKLRAEGVGPRLLWLPAIYFTLLHMVFVGSLRYRQPALVVLTPLAGAAVAEACGRRRTSTAQRRDEPIAVASEEAPQ